MCSCRTKLLTLPCLKYRFSTSVLNWRSYGFKIKTPTSSSDHRIHCASSGSFNIACSWWINVLLCILNNHAEPSWLETCIIHASPSLTMAPSVFFFFFFTFDPAASHPLWVMPSLQCVSRKNTRQGAKVWRK